MTSKTSYIRHLIKDIWIASRPLSLTLALYSTTLGIVIAHLEGKLFTDNLSLDLRKIFLVTVAGLFVQTATNFINDYFECEYKYRRQSSKKYSFLGKKRTRFDILIFLLGIVCFFITAFIGLYLVHITTPRLLIVGILGILGGYSYTGEPIVYKKKGLGTPLSFILMGPLMIYGSYLVFAQRFSWNPIILGLPVSFMIPLLMLSNELRDFERDKRLNIQTLTVRIGYARGKKLFLSLLIGAYGLTTIYVFLRMIPAAALLVFVTIPLAIISFKTVSSAKKEGVPITNKLHLSFGLIFILALLIK
ncbi:MAG: 1,4-dihydroxy-2-naphthoate polyprenyltransferase [Candidatus Petromonas sp.]|jgi:1,4-dihydroxy-2-naphthoate octaprenyltransferase|nr:1,4-dihydroxy-2-naphthoate polyprenyltransferase [Candidatus Petromonas sp.]